MSVFLLSITFISVNYTSKHLKTLVILSIIVGEGLLATSFRYSFFIQSDLISLAVVFSYLGFIQLMIVNEKTNSILKNQVNLSITN